MERNLEGSGPPQARQHGWPDLKNARLRRENAYLSWHRLQEVERAWTAIGFYYYARVCRDWSRWDLARLDAANSRAHESVSACRDYDAIAADADEAMRCITELRNQIDRVEELRQRRSVIAWTAGSITFALSFLWLSQTHDIEELGRRRSIVAWTTGAIAFILLFL